MHTENKFGKILCPFHARKITRAEFSDRTKKLVLFQDFVADVSNFEHPGGNEFIEEHLGQDISKLYLEVGHSKQADYFLKEMFVGYIEKECFRNLNEEKDCTCNLAIKPEASKEISELRTKGDEYEKECFGNEKKIHSRRSLDLNKPLVSQVYRMSRENYMQLLTEPNCTKTIARLMPYDWMEPLSKVQWWQPPVLWTPVIIIWGFQAMKYYGHTWLSFTPYCIVGLFGWTFVEYFLHRFVFHFPPTLLPDHGAFRVVHFLAHEVHHVLPNDPLRLVVPPALFIVLASLTYLFLSIFLPQTLLFCAWPAGLCGYLMYDLIHYSTHHFAILERIPHIKSMKRYHMKHHFKYPLLGFGVSNKMWDYVFGTTIP